MTPSKLFGTYGDRPSLAGRFKGNLLFAWFVCALVPAPCHGIKAATARHPAIKVETWMGEWGLCHAVSARLNSTRDPIALLQKGQFTGGDKLVHPKWKRIAPPPDIANILYSFYVAAHKESVWPILRPKLLEYVATGKITTEILKIRLSTYDTFYTDKSPAEDSVEATLYRISDSSKDSGDILSYSGLSGVGWHYVVHSVEHYPVIHDAPILDGSQNDLFFYDKRPFVIGTPYAPHGLVVEVGSIMQHYEYNFIGVPGYRGENRFYISAECFVDFNGLKKKGELRND